MWLTIEILKGELWISFVHISRIFAYENSQKQARKVLDNSAGACVGNRFETEAAFASIQQRWGCTRTTL